MNEARSCGMLRLAAYAIDGLLIGIWMCVLFGSVMFATGGNVEPSAGPWQGQAIGFVSMTIPVTLYFTLMERSAWHATVGKRLVGLVVFRPSGEPLSLARALLRNALKFTPWEFGHTLTQQMYFSSQDAMPLWLWGPAVVAILGPVWWVASLLIAGRAPYDKWSDVHVARRHRNHQ